MKKLSHPNPDTPLQLQAKTQSHTEVDEVQRSQAGVNRKQGTEEGRRACCPLNRSKSKLLANFMPGTLSNLSPANRIAGCSSQVIQDGHVSSASHGYTKVRSIHDGSDAVQNSAILRGLREEERQMHMLSP